MKNHLCCNRWRAIVAVIVSMLPLLSAHGQTYTWADNAQGQPYEVCPSGLGPQTHYYPSNNLWIQSAQTNGNCDNTAIVQTAPSNWDPAPPVGLFPGGPGLTGVDAVLGAPANTFLSAGDRLSLNSLTIETNGSLGIGANWSIAVNRLEFQGDGEILSGPGGFVIGNGGSLIKSGGTNSFDIVNPSITGSNVLVEVASGSLILPTGFEAANLDGGTFAISNNATLLLTPDSGATPSLSGNFTGVGGGTVLFNNGALASAGCSLNLPGNMFQWTYGSLKGGPFTNFGVFNITNVGAQFYGGATLYNYNLINLATNSALDFFSPGGAAPALHNQAGAMFDIQGDDSITTGSGAIYNSGLFIKSAGTGLSQITPAFNNLNGVIEVDSGTLDLNMTAGGDFSNVTFVVSNTATLLFLTNNLTMEIEGALTGTGGGAVLMNNGRVASSFQATLNFRGSMFQWAGGKLGISGSSVPLTNLGVINITGPVGESGTIANNGAIIQSATGAVGGSAGFTGLNNNIGSIYEIQNDNGIAMTTFNNSGLFVKSAGTNASLVTCPHFNDFGPAGAVEADTGAVIFAGNNNYFFTNTSFTVSNGASVGLSSSNNTTELEGSLTGSGSGTVFINNGTLFSSYPTTLNFPGAMLQWQGGKLGSPSGSLLTNLGTMTVSGPVAIDGFLANNGSMIQTGAGSIGNNSFLNNNAGASYQIQNDNGLSINTVNNNGLFEKTSGAGISLVTANFNNSGAIQGLSGSLVFTNGTFTQNAGVLELSSSVICQGAIQENGGVITGVGVMGNPGPVSMTVNGGVVAPGNPFGALTWNGHFSCNMAGAAAFSVVLGGPSAFSQLQAPNTSVTVAGTLNVTLTNGYAPPIGAQFQIISASSRGGSFSTLNVPAGISVTYSNNGVFLVVTGAVPAQLTSPEVAGADFTFGFGTVSNQSYTIQQNADLRATNWTFYTNFIGDGSFFQLITPSASPPQNFFRVRQP